MTRYLVIYRPHNKFNFETQYFGPFDDHDDAYEYLCSLPAIGAYIAPEEGVISVGCKHIEELTTPSPLGWAVAETANEDMA